MAFPLQLHTFENKSSSAALNPPAGLLAPPVWPVLDDHPPNSSSAWTLGAGLKPPEAPGTIGVLAKELEDAPQPPKSLDAVVVLVWAGAALGVEDVSLEPPQALLPQTSAPAMPLLPKDDAAAGAGEGLTGGET